MILSNRSQSTIDSFLEGKKVCKADKFMDLCNSNEFDEDYHFLAEVPIEPNCAYKLEGYLFPDTYEFYLGEDAKYVINKMLVNFDARVTDELRGIIADKGKTIHEIVIAASLIEKETDGTDQARISSVIYNRLKSNVTLCKL